MTDLPPFVKTIKRTRSIGIDLGTLTLSESVNLYDALINKAARENPVQEETVHLARRVRTSVNKSLGGSAWTT